jgi:pyruvate/2-oxoglutarate dehydrogenase complex dihydrolipoamide dehydrogenase (E3) component
MAEPTATWDVAIIGGGGAGLAVAAACLEAGRRAVLFERDAPGGALRRARAMTALQAAARRAALGARPLPRPAPPAVTEQDELLGPFQARGLTVVPSSAHFVAPDRLEAAGRSYVFRHAVVTAGSAAVVPDLDGLATVPWLTPDTLLLLDETPEHLLVLGGGAEAVALAQAYALLGRRVSLIQPEPNLLPDDEIELVVPLREALRRAGVLLHENSAVTAVEHAGANLAVVLNGGARIEGSHLLLALGKAPNLSPLDLPAGQVEATARGIAVKPDLRSTSNRRVFAAGSVADTGLGAAAAGHHAAVVADAMLRGSRTGLGPVAPPRLVPTWPALAQLGLTESAARAAGHDPKVLRVPLPDGAFGPEAAKLIADRQGRLLGAGLLSEQAGEASAFLALAAARGLTGAEMAALPLPPGTLAELLARAAGNLGGAEFHSSPGQRILGALARWK